MDKRAQIIEMLKNNQLDSYRVGQDEYVVPYIRTSHTGKMIVQKRNDITKIMFHIYKGVAISRGLVYVSDDSGVVEDDFNFDIGSFK